MKNLKDIIKESLRIGINDKPEFEFDLENIDELYSINLIYSHKEKRGILDVGVQQECEIKNEKDNNNFLLNSINYTRDGRYVDYPVTIIDEFLCSATMLEDNDEINTVFGTTCVNIFLTTNKKHDFQNLLNRIIKNNEIKIEEICKIIDFDISYIPDTYQITYWFDNSETRSFNEICDYIL